MLIRAQRIVANGRGAPAVYRSIPRQYRPYSIFASHPPLPKYKLGASCIPQGSSTTLITFTSLRSDRYLSFATTPHLRQQGRNDAPPEPRTRPSTKSTRHPQNPEFSKRQPEVDSKSESAEAERDKRPFPAAGGPIENDASDTEAFLSKMRQESTEQDAGLMDEPHSPTGPLPDLRHGIPSTFEAEFSDRSSSPRPAKTDRTELDITEETSAPGGGRREDGERELPKDAYVSSIDRRRNQFMRWAYTALLSVATAATVFLGRNWSNEAEAEDHPEAPNGWNILHFYARIKARLGPLLGYYTEPTFPKLLPDMDPVNKPPLTLVLSLEDLLLSSTWDRDKGWKVAKRPGVDYFIRYLSQYYELCIFTTVQSMNADPVIRKLDPFRFIMWPLFREATRYINGENVKDLSYLNRDLSKVIIIDTVPAHVQLQPENAIILPKWNGRPSDSHAKDLVALIPFLEYLATAQSVTDVRKVLASFEGKNIPDEFAAREARAREEFNKQLAEERAKRPGMGSLRGLGSKLGFRGGGAMPGEQSPQEAMAEGKMWTDIVRERGQRNYQLVEKDLRENGKYYLEEMEKDEKRAQEEMMKSMQGSVAGFLNFGGRPGQGGSDEKKG